VLFAAEERLRRQQRSGLKQKTPQVQKFYCHCVLVVVCV